MDEDGIAYTDDNIVLRFSSEMESHEQGHSDTASMIHTSKSIVVLGRKVPSKNYIRGTLLMIAILALVVIILSIVLGKHTATPCPQPECHNSSSCTSPGCKLMSARRDFIKDDSLSQCKNFYRHSCGRYDETLSSVSGGDHKKWDIYQEMTQSNHAKLINYLRQPLATTEDKESFVSKVKQFFQTCFHDSEFGKPNIITELKDIFPNFVNFATLDDVISSDWEPTEVWTKLQWKYSVEAFFKINFLSDSNHLLMVDSEVSDFISKFNLTQYSKIEGIYRKYIAEVMNLLIPNSPDKNASALIERLSDDVISVQKDLVKASKKSDEPLRYTRISIQNLTEKVPHIQWLQFFRGLVNSSSFISNESVVFLSDLNYAIQASKYFTAENKSKFYHYMVWRLIEFYSRLGDLPLRTAYQSYLDSAQSILPSVPIFKSYSAMVTYPRTYTCYHLAWRYLPEALNAIFTQQFLPGTVRDVLVKLRTEIIQEVTNSTDSAAWMRDLKKAVKQEILIRGMVGSDTMDLYYHDLSLSLDFSSSLLSVISYRRQEWINLITHKTNLPSSVTGADSVLTARDPYLMNNRVVIPAGVLQLPYFSSDANISWLWARLGGRIIKSYLASIRASNWKSKDLLDTRKCISKQLSDEKAGPFHTPSGEVYVDIPANESSELIDDFLMEYFSVQLSMKILINKTAGSLTTNREESIQNFFYAYSQMLCECAASSDLYIEALKYPLVKEILVNNVISQSKRFLDSFHCPSDKNVNFCYSSHT